jgi:hypothetical protein
MYYHPIRRKDSKFLRGALEKHSHAAPLFSTTDVGILERSRIVRNPAVRQACLIGPFVRLLSLPRPHDPSARLLVRDDLS